MHKEKGTNYVISEGDVVTVYNEGHPRGLLRLGKIEGLIRGADGVIRGVLVRVASQKGHPKTLRRPLQYIYPLEVRGETTEEEIGDIGEVTPDKPNHPSSTPEPSVPRRSTQSAAAQARDRILGCAIRDSSN